MRKRYNIINGVSSGFLVLDADNGECLGWYATRYAANKARRLAINGEGSR